MYISGLILPWISYFLDLLGNNFDAHFSEQTLKRLRVKDNSFLRKIIPLKEGDIIKNGEVYGHRYYLYTRVIPLFIQSILLIVGLIILAINLIFVAFLPDFILGIIGGILHILCLIYTAIINILSQGFHI